MFRSFSTMTVCVALLWTGPAFAGSSRGSDNQCKDRLASCQEERNECTGVDLPACTSDLGTCQEDAATCADSLAQCEEQSASPRVLISPALSLNTQNPTDSLLCLVSNLSTGAVSVNVEFVDGLGSSTYCGVSSLTLAAGTQQGVPCAPNPNNFISYCRITITSSEAAPLRGNHCIVDALSNARFCSEAH